MRTLTFGSLCVSILLTLTCTSKAGAPYLETGGRVVVEAEHFDSRTPATDDNHKWVIAPDELTAADKANPEGQYLNARGGKYMVVLPSGILNRNSTDLQAAGPYMDYKVQIATTGEYQLYLRDSGFNGSSDSIYARIVELQTSAGGPGPDWYRYAPDPDSGDFSLVLNNPDDANSTAGWEGYGTPEVNNGGNAGDRVPVVWKITKAGIYTVRVQQREDGNGLDALILQLSSLPVPADPGPPESALAGTFVRIDQDVQDVTVAVGKTITLSVKASGSATPTYQWQKAAPGSKTFSPIAGATAASYTTPALAAADSGTQYQVVASVPGAQNATGRAATVRVDAIPPSIVSVTPSFNLSELTVVYSEPVTAASASDKANYTIDGGLTVSSVAVTSSTTVKLSTTKQTPGTSYKVTVKNVVDIAAGGGNSIAPNTQVSFTGYLLQIVSARTFGTQNKVRVVFNGPVMPSGSSVLLSDDFSGASLDSSKWRIDDKAFEVGTATTSTAVAQKNGGIEFSIGVDGQYWPGRALATVSKFTASDSSPLIFDIDRVSHTGTGTAHRTGIWIADGTRDNYVLFAENTGEGNWQFNRQIGQDGDIATGTGRVTPLVNGGSFNDKGNHHIRAIANGKTAKFYVDDNYAADVPFPFGNGIVFEFGSYARATGDTLKGVFDNAVVTKVNAPVASSFSIDNGVTVTGVALTSNPDTLELTTSAIAAGKSYTLSVSNVQGIGGNTITANSKIAIDLSAPVSKYPTAVLADKPILYFRMDEQAGTASPNLGSAGNAAQGTYVPEIQAGAGPRLPDFPGFDKDNTAAMFDGANSYLATAAQLLQDAPAFSIECWVKPITLAGTSRVGLVGQNDAVEWGFINPTTVEIWTPSGGSIDTGRTFPNNEWHYLTTVGDGTNLKNYFDGKLIQTGGTATGDYGSSTFNVNVGGGGVFDATGNWFPGLIDEVAIYDKALTANQIKAHFDAAYDAASHPTVAISSPKDGATVAEGAPIAFAVTASAATGKTISKVEIFQGATKAGESTSSPFTVTVGALAAGRYPFTAKATDNQGITGVSTAVNIVVGGGPPPLPIVGAPYLETGGRVVVEAEHFDSRTPAKDDNHKWVIAPDELTAADKANPEGQYLNARGGKYMVVLPSGVLNRNSADLQAAGPYLDYKVQIATTGEYQLYLRDSGFNGSSDSVYARIMELQKPAGGPGPDWYRYAPDPDSGDFSLVLNNPDDANSTAGWEGYGTPEVNDGGNTGDRVKVVWNITKAGIYTVRIQQREDGNGLDALILQLSSLPVPANPGPPESATITVAVAPKFSAPTVQGGNLVLTWSGTGALQSADAVTGPWADVASAKSPLTVKLSGNAKFYRVKQ